MKIPSNTFLVLLMSWLLLLSCSTKKNYQSNDQHQGALKPFVLKFERGPCFGKCPVYSFYLLSDHTGLVHSKANLTDTAGWYAAQLDQEAIVEILELIEPREWWLPDIQNLPEVADLPSSSLTYRHPSGVRTVSTRNRIVASLESVFAKINTLVTQGMWKPSDLRPVEPQVAEQTDVIVQLKEGIDIYDWMKKYERFGIHLKKRLTPNHPYFLVAKSPNKGNANDFLQYIKSDSDVVNAQWDKQVQQRD